MYLKMEQKSKAIHFEFPDPKPHTVRAHVLHEVLPRGKAPALEVLFKLD